MSRSPVLRVLVGRTALVLALSAAVGIPLFGAVPAAFAQPCSGPAAGGGSLDGDGVPDLAVGQAGGLALGAVDVRLTGTGSQQISEDDLGLPRTAWDWGSALSEVDLNYDGCADLVVGAPDVDGPKPRLGAVDLVLGSPVGLSSVGAHQLVSTHAGDEFGIALAASGRADPKSDKVVTDLWVGAPDRTEKGLVDAGAVEHYQVSAAGVPTHIATITAASVDGTIHAHARFGATLAAGENSVVIGAPGDTVHGQIRAGSASWVQLNATTGAITTTRYWTQHTAGVPGAPEPDDRFGAAVSETPTGTRYAVGIPDESLGTHTDAGMVQVFSGTMIGKAYTQNSRGIPGTVETGDHFGTAVQLGIGITCANSVDLAVGAPGESIRTTKQAGSVTLISLADDEGPCAARVYYQGSGLPGAHTTGNQAGAALGLLRDPFDGESGASDHLLVGIPGWDYSPGYPNAGEVVWNGHHYTDSRGLVGDEHYGLRLVESAGGSSPDQQP